MTGQTIGIIGAGAIGQTVAALLTHEPWCTQVLVTTRTTERARGLVTDLEDMRQVAASPARVQAATAADLFGSDALVICPRATFTNTANRDVRMAGLAANAPLIAGLARTLTGYAGVAVMVTNPVDVLARLFARISGAATYGVGSATDTARYRLTLAGHYRVPVETVDGYVIGEHGDHAVICASSTTVAGETAPVPLDLVRTELTARPRRINQGIGRTRCGPAAAVPSALRHLTGYRDGTDVLSVNREGVWIGIRLRIRSGQPTVHPLVLDERETAQFLAARTKLNAAYQQIQHHEQGEALCR
ncbi:lactate/malate family dehydrogenase [Streptomyces halobius]|uniref:NAD(P)-binding domain-containing protein n=1 Tax=Streptomyces halobius TaxID=2879846 RepID=A0ABY4MD52_9ACTN|nr:NAD(P)-binding domain-containing protein [Streptomyces halobius]UQA95705.1 NAD(P)-binding domain-containing protein [Streptomyces halobius]